MKLKSIEAPQPNRRLQFIGDRAPLACGHGSQSYHCADCDELLLVSLNPREIAGVVFRCPTCGAYNELDTIEQHGAMAQGQELAPDVRSISGAS